MSDRAARANGTSPLGAKGGDVSVADGHGNVDALNPQTIAAKPQQGLGSSPAVIVSSNPTRSRKAETRAVKIPSHESESLAE